MHFRLRRQSTADYRAELGGSARVLPSLLITHYGLSSDAPNVAAISM